MNTFWEYFQAIVIIGAYYVTRLVAKTGGGGGLRRSSGIRLHGTQSLGKDKSVSVVEIGDFVYILGVSMQRVELIDKLPKSETAFKKEEQTPPPPSFGTSFREELNKRFRRQDKND